MAISISRAQRDTIREDLLCELGGMDDIARALHAGDWQQALVARREYEEALRLLDDLGWDPNDPRRLFALVTSAPDALARVLGRLRSITYDALRDYGIDSDRPPGVDKPSAEQSAPGPRRAITAWRTYDVLLAEIGRDAATTQSEQARRRRIDLATERRRRGLSTRAAAHEIGVSQAVVLRAEGGDGVWPRHAKRIADFYGVRVTDIWPVW
jgi:lambda repressor-like predicted transcriptional regulator